ncbi:uncharacterized protein LOC123907336 [Trifolium pratense]|uniref:uncharacterized protein LOC123907336 n=1 Tax=Trifolium pratense TaxID=57577 RepID=UPI001E695E4D|nr:uncharacterized protein LOC123907336 [Trifolium pratense]
MKRNFNFTSTIYPTEDYDFIGNESCIDFQSENDVFNIDHQNTLTSSTDKKITRCIRYKDKKREFPPPIHCLAQIENHASLMRYALTRYYTNEGRLIIKEEKLHHEYIQSHRENGRLTLQLVSLDNEDDEEEEQDEQEEELASLPTSPQDINNVTFDQSVVINDGFEEKEEENKDNTQKSVSISDEVVVENENEIVGGANSRGNCLNCNSMISAPSGIFGVLPLHPLRIVRG